MIRGRGHVSSQTFMRISGGRLGNSVKESWPLAFKVLMNLFRPLRSEGKDRDTLTIGEQNVLHNGQRGVAAGLRWMSKQSASKRNALGRNASTDEMG